MAAKSEPFSVINPPSGPSPPRSVEGWLISTIVHCTLMLALALSVFPAGARINDATVLVLGPESSAPESLFTLDNDPITSQAADTLPQLQQVESQLDLISATSPTVGAPQTIDPSWLTAPAAPLDLQIGGDTSKQGDAVFFGTSASGRDFIFILDCSGSMSARSNARFLRARDELVNTVSKLRSDQRFYVYLFNWSTFPMFGADDPGELVPADGENITKLRAWLYSIVPDSGTDPRRALRGSMAMNPDAIFLLSDGKFNRPSHTDLLLGWDASPSTVFDLFVGDRWPGVQVNTIAFEDQNAAVGMQKLADLTGGQFRFVAAPGEESDFGLDTKVTKDSLPVSAEEKLILAKQVLLIRRAEKLVERKLSEHAKRLVEQLDPATLPDDVRQRLDRIRSGG
jgi:hypothetical protein